MGHFGVWSRRIRAIPLGTSLLIGSGTFVLGYVTTFLVVLLDAVVAGGSDSDTAGDVADQLLEFVATLFYEAHTVQTGVESLADVTSTGLLAELNLALPTGVYYAIPVVLLTSGGFANVRRGTAGGLSPGRAAGVGASIVIAYLPLIAIGASVVTLDGSVWAIDYTLAPNGRQAILRAGLFYPLGFGALGGLAAGLRQRHP